MPDIVINKIKKGCVKSQPPPPGTSARVLLLKKEEKVNVLIIKYFPSFPRRGVMPEGHDGVVGIISETPSYFFDRNKL